MGREMVKTALQLLLIIFLLPAVFGISFKIDVAELTDHSFKGLEYSENISELQEINATVENVGSIGCTYRMRADFQQGNQTFERFSSPEPLWQGEYDRMEIKYIPEEYTGEVGTNISLEYCGQKKQVDSFSFNVTENTTISAEVESRTIESRDESARIEVKGDTLIPQIEPSYWKTSSAEINNGTAEIEYDAPIFDQREEITYTVLEDGEIKGSTNVSLEPEPNLKEKLLDRKLEIVLCLLGISVLSNLLLILKQRGLIEKIRQFEYELPEFRDKN
jgi:uncharacterized beta-barrel protein YwiB (DUF1934 family)